MSARSGENYKADAQPCLPWGQGRGLSDASEGAELLPSTLRTTGGFCVEPGAGWHLQELALCSGTGNSNEGRVPIALYSGSSSDPRSPSCAGLGQVWGKDGRLSKFSREDKTVWQSKLFWRLHALISIFLEVFLEEAMKESAKSINQDHELNLLRYSLAILVDCWTQTHQWTHLTSQHRSQASGESLCLEGLWKGKSLGSQTRILSK